jgi:hypothetical protein
MTSPTLNKQQNSVKKKSNKKFATNSLKLQLKIFWNLKSPKKLQGKVFLDTRCSIN